MHYSLHLRNFHGMLQFVLLAFRPVRSTCMAMMDSSRQKQHYTEIHDAYEAHYYDAPSMEYRSRFIYRWLFAGVDFSNTTVADLACGSGYNSLALKQRFDRVRTVGFDISEPAWASYRAPPAALHLALTLRLPFP